MGARYHEGNCGNAEALTWKDNPAIPKGGQFAILIGDPTKAGDVVVQRVKFPANYQVPPHTHPYVEDVTVISGSVGFGMGEKFEKKGEMVKAGALLANPARHAHYVWTGDEGAIVQVQFTGPGGIDYINPPTIHARNKTGSTSNSDPLDLVERDQIGRPVVELWWCVGSRPRPWLGPLKSTTASRSDPGRHS